MGKENVVYMHNEEQNHVICRKMGGTGDHCVK
jgi:hypothetical protein